MINYFLAKKRPEENEYTHLSSELSTFYQVNTEVCHQLITLGFTKDQIRAAFKCYNFNTFEEACAIMLPNAETNLYDHKFTGTDFCQICLESVEKHTIVTANATLSHTTTIIPLLQTDENDESLCSICFDQKKDEPVLSCDHSFCLNCVKSYLESKINNGTAPITCLQIGCPTEYSQENIDSMCEDSSKHRYKRLLCIKKFRSSDYNLMPCVYPDCQEMIDNTERSLIVTCNSDHTFCVTCKEITDFNGHECQTRVGGDQLVSLAKAIELVVKKCPKCFVLLSKDDGCNHITCSYCAYEFCWLCSQKYTENHFSVLNLQGCAGKMYCSNLIR